MTWASRPVIGVVTYGRRDKWVENLLFDEYLISPARYTVAVRRAGGIPILLPPAEARVEDWLCAFDRVILTGGADIDPVHYNANSDHLFFRFLARSRRKWISVDQTIDVGQKTPALLICWRMQLLNVAVGGALHEHILDIRDKDIHRGHDGGRTLKPVDLDPASNLIMAM